MSQDDIKHCNGWLPVQGGGPRHLVLLAGVDDVESALVIDLEVHVLVVKRPNERSNVPNAIRALAKIVDNLCELCDGQNDQHRRPIQRAMPAESRHNGHCAEPR